MPNLDRDYYLDKQGLQTLVNELETNIVAEEFSTSATYNLGDYCIYGNLLYICTTPITTAGSWTGSTNWLQVLIGDELSEKTEIQTITLAQWEALTPEQKASGDYVISDATFSPLSASLMPYDNTTSGLTADDVQEAIDEIASGGVVGSLNDLTDVTISNVQDKQELVYNDTNDVFENKTTRIELTQAQYDALATPETDVDYYITDAPSMSGSSKDLSYDGTTKSTYTKIEEIDSEKANASDLSTVATSGYYSDLLNKPTIAIATNQGNITSATFTHPNLANYSSSMNHHFLVVGFSIFAICSIREQDSSFAQITNLGSVTVSGSKSANTLEFTLTFSTTSWTGVRVIYLD